MEEVVIGHIWHSTAGLFHDLHCLMVDLPGFLQREELLHFLQRVFKDHEVASVCWASIKLIQIVLVIGGREEGEKQNENLTLPKVQAIFFPTANYLSKVM